jgi:hypothetical protein
MNDRRREERLYTAVLVAFGIGLVAFGILGVPALLVAAAGAVVAAAGIALFHRHLEGPRAGSPTRRGSHRKVPAKYVPSVLEGSRVKRRHTVHQRRRRQASPPPRFR